MLLLFFQLLPVSGLELLPLISSFSPKDFDFQGYRGCRGLISENTIAAMKKAMDLGVTTLELDVVISADNKVVVSKKRLTFFSLSCRNIL